MEFYNNWWEEKRSAYLYSVMAASEINILHKKLFTDLQAAAEKQAIIWEDKMQSSSMPVEPFKPDMRTRIVAWLVKIVGAERIHFLLASMKIRGMSVFTRYHSEHKHTSFNATSNLRAAVFGVNDGLVSNVSLILGMAGASAGHHNIVLAGVAGLLAGACSMGAGEYISVRSQREVFEYQIKMEEEELREYPEEEMAELSLIYQARGIPEDEANRLSELMIKNPETALNTLAREELGINPDDMVSPVGAMIYSFIAFSVGALIPLLPFLFGDLSWSMTASITATATSLFAIGAMLSLYTNRNPILLGMRMMMIGVFAGGLTFIIGKLVESML